jgi:Cytochrome c7 and related cytochrome c
MRNRLLVLTPLVVVLLAWVLVRQSGARPPAVDPLLTAAAPAAQATAIPAQLKVEVPPPPFSEGVFPCTDCHDNKDLKPNRTRRELKDAHDDIILKHDEEHRWCLDCHDADNRDRLHLASGQPVPFEESYQVCGQCHGEKYRDWRAGVHGRRVGYWNGAKQYLLCVNCHSPHQPRFKPLAPKPAPNRPTRPGAEQRNAKR